MCVTYLFCVDFSFCCSIRCRLILLAELHLVSKTSFHPDSYWASSGLRKNKLLCLIWVLGCFMCMLRWGCSLCMPRMFYCSMHRLIGWEGLSMVIDGCSVHIPIIIINSKLWSAKQDSVPYTVKVIHIHIPIECGDVGPYVDGFLIHSC